MILSPNGTGIVDINSTQSIKVPVGDNAARPTSPTVGMIRFNTELSRYEGFDGSLWIQMGCQTRVVDGLLEIKSDTAMLGYINAPSPFTDDGWYRTGDMVEVDGDYLKILGRKSELINIGGMKIHPMEIESVIQEMDITRDVVVMDETNFILGKIVTAKIVTDIPISEEQLLKEIRSYCKGRIDKCFIPMKVFIVEESLISGRYKKIRK
jgi:acyl-CoA synthetase (AMP-forming)/AMP-acid ligase II